MEIIKSISQQSIGTAVAVGYFDGVHLGHRAVIGSAAQAAGQLGVKSTVLSFDMSAFRAQGKGKSDLMPPHERERVLEGMGIDILALPDFQGVMGMTCEEFVQRVLIGWLGARSVSCGGDFRFGKNRAGGADTLRELCGERGIELKIVPDVMLNGEPVSTTRIKSAIESGDVALAGALLGRPYGLELPVVSGQHLGTRLGFATINQRFPQDIVQPRYGVYGARIIIDGREYRGITNIGVRPTVSNSGSAVMETHIFDFDGDLYGRNATVELMFFLRDERRFASAAELRAQVLADCETVRNAEF